LSSVCLTPIRDMFDSLVPGYDWFNRLSSLGFDKHWRRSAARYFSPGSYVLDVGTGTGDLARALARQGTRVLGVDFSPRMIRAAQEKFSGRTGMAFQTADASNLPFEANHFDGVVSGFVLRNLYKGGVLGPSFRNFHRVLKPLGRMVHLELTRPPKGILSVGHKLYLSSILPLIGKTMFGRRWPKNYLSETIEVFPRPAEMCQRIGI